MDAHRWKDIDGVFAAALECDGADRVAFLDRACGGDEQLRAEVESLLAHVVPGSLTREQGVEEATRLLEKSEPKLANIGRYRITRSLGAGGMGHVYLGLDEQLNRPVAVKLISHYDASDEERTRRFRQEALAASALNHPNILTIYEIGEFEGANFITSEFVDGVTLRARMKAGVLPPDATVDVVIQIAGALSAAHAAGIIHRDIKPENVMVRGDGLVKVLDFGVAKFTQGKDNGKQDLVETLPGRIIGTAAYMSPEQARGILIDSRTDIWSLGVILYELIAGRPPFEGNTAADVIAAVIERQPLPSNSNGSVTLESLERIAIKALQKEPEKRYQTAAELLAELKQLKQTMERERSDSASAAFPSQAGRAGKEGELKPGSSELARTARHGAATISSAEYLFSRIKYHKYAALACLLALITAVAFLAYRSLLSGKSHPIESIAVMPFTNESGNGEIEYLSDGMTDSLINSLSQIPHLSVKARSSVFRYKGKEVEPQRLATELSVQAILSGRVVQHGNDLTLYLSLVEARNGNQIWGEQYERKLSDLVGLQQEISRKVSEQLRLKLTGEEQKRVEKRYTNSSEAYELYLKGRYFASSPSEINLKKSIEYYQQAIDKDPNYALAYAGIGASYQTMGGVLGFVSPSEAAPQGRAAILKALAMDETLDEAHATLAQYFLTYDWNLSAAEREYKRTFELNPNNSAGRGNYGTYLEALGRFDEAVAERERSRQADPVSALYTADVGYPLYYARRYDGALEHFQKGLQLDPNFSWAHLWIGQVYVQQRRYDEAIKEIKKAIALSAGNVRDIATLGHAYAVAGRRDDALKVLAELQDQSKQKYVSPYFIALIYAGLGDTEQAFAWLEKAYQQRHPYLILIKVEPVFENLHSDPRFADLTRKIGLPQ